MQRRRIGLVGAILLLLALSASAQTPALSEIDRLKAENHLLKVQVAQLQSLYAQAQEKMALTSLQSERSQLVEEFRKTLKVDATQEFDWTTLTFKPRGGQ